MLCSHKLCIHLDRCLNQRLCTHHFVADGIAERVYRAWHERYYRWGPKILEPGSGTVWQSRVSDILIFGKVVDGRSQSSASLRNSLWLAGETEHCRYRHNYWSPCVSLHSPLVWEPIQQYRKRKRYAQTKKCTENVNLVWKAGAHQTRFLYIDWEIFFSCDRNRSFSRLNY